MYLLCFRICMPTVKSTRARKISNRIFLEGERVIEDALKAGAVAESIFFSDPKLLKRIPLKHSKNIELFQVHYDKIQLWSDLTTSPGIIGIYPYKCFFIMALKFNLK